MTREFNQNQRYDSRPPYRDSTSNNRYGATQPSQPTKPRLNRATVDRAWENGAPHRHADYNTRQSHEAGVYDRQQQQKSWRNRQPSEYSSRDHSPYERDARHNDQRISRHDSLPQRTDTFSGEYPGNRYNPSQHSRTFADQQGQRHQQENGNEENTYRSRNGHPNFSHSPQNFNRGRYNQEVERSDRQAGDSRAYNADAPYRRYDREQPQPRERQFHPYNQQGEQYDRRERFEERPQQKDFHPSRYPAHQTKPAWGRDQQERQENRHSEQFKGDYEQFNHSSIPQPEQRKKYDHQQHSPQPHDPKAVQPEERHVTRLPDGRVLKGPRPAQRKNAQFWTEVASNTDELVKHVQQPATTPEQDEERTKQHAQTTPLPITRHLNSSRTKTTKRVTARAQEGKAEKPASNVPIPRPSQRGFKWPTPPTRAAE